MTKALRYDHIVQALPDGSRGLFVLPAIPEDASPTAREGLARRRIAALTGECPCGSEVSLSRQQRRARQRQRAKAAVTRIVFSHEPGCPATDEILIPLLREWAANQAGEQT